MKRATMAMAVTLFACASVECGGTTGGNLIEMPLEAGGISRDASQPFSFVSGQGWTVTLTAAEAVLGPLYFNIDAPEPSVFRSGVVIVQAPELFTVDLLSSTLKTVSGGANGETGHAVSVEIGFYTAAESYNEDIDGGLPAPLASNGQQGTAYLAGQASKNGAVVQFAGRVQITNALVSGLDPIDEVARVAGANCDLVFTKTSGTIELRVDPTHWFDQANFCSLVTAAGTGGTAGAAGGASGADAAAGAAGGQPGAGGASGAGAATGGQSGMASAPCAPVAGQVYSWTDTNPFNSEVLGGMKNTVGVYLFSLAGQP
jgi:hypothetical protein